MVEEYSEDYFKELSKLIPEQLKYKKPLKTESFIKFQNSFTALSDDYKDVEEIYSEALRTKNYLFFDDAVKEELKTAEQLNNILSERFEWYYENNDSPMKELGKLRQVAKSLKYKTLIEIQKGDFDKAKHYFTQSKEFASKCWGIKGPFLVKLVMNAVQSIDYSIIYEVIEKDMLSLKQLMELYEIQKVSLLIGNLDYHDMISAELYRDTLWSAVIKLGQPDYVIMDLYGMALFDDNPQATIEWIKNELTKKDNFNCEEFLIRNVEFFSALQIDVESRAPIKKLKSQKVLDGMFTKNKTVYSEIRRLTLKTYARAIRKNNIVHTKGEVSELLLALIIYEKENGQLPESMNALLSKYLSKVPIDYNTGLPVKYDKENRKILILGVGDSEYEIPF